MAALGKGLYLPTYEFVDPRSALYDAIGERQVRSGQGQGTAYRGWLRQRVRDHDLHGLRQDLAAVVQQNLADVGITAKVEIIDTGALFGMSMNGWQKSGLIAPFPSGPGTGRRGSGSLTVSSSAAIGPTP